VSEGYADEEYVVEPPADAPEFADPDERIMRGADPQTMQEDAPAPNGSR
jgi:hypothetical protein